MTRTFIQTDEFSFRWDALGFHDDDLRRLEFDIMMKHDKYPVISGRHALHLNIGVKAEVSGYVMLIL